MKFIENLHKRFEEPLPGLDAQLKMSSIRRRMANFDYEMPETHKNAAVLCLLFPKNDEWHIGLMKRTAHEKDKHAGQISFPGGSYETTDPSFEYTAIRETEEEIGVPQNEINIIGKMTNLYIPISNFLVHPYVGFCETQPNFVPDASEVAAVLQPSVRHLLHPTTRKTKTITTHHGWTMKDVPYFDIEGDTLWGATAMMMNEFLEIAKELHE